MTPITFNNWQTEYEVSDELAAELTEFIALKQRRINELEDAIRYAKMKAETAHRKPTKLLKLEAHHARKHVYSLVGSGVRQLELMK